MHVFTALERATGERVSLEASRSAVYPDSSTQQAPHRANRVEPRGELMREIILRERESERAKKSATYFTGGTQSSFIECLNNIPLSTENVYTYIVRRILDTV